jgi:hypothetical protein
LDMCVVECTSPPPPHSLALKVCHRLTPGLL